MAKSLKQEEQLGIYEDDEESDNDDDGDDEEEGNILFATWFWFALDYVYVRIFRN